jgi:hypothetical protein
MADLPDRLDAARHRELAGRRYMRPARYVVLGLVAAVVVLGLLNVFGQRADTSTGESSRASLEVYAPARVRGGLLYEARFTIRAHRKLSHAVLQLAPGWAESQQINTIEPSPIAETSRDGKLLLTLGAVPKGRRFTLYLELQVNPTNVGRRSTDVTLYDGDARLLTIERTLTVFP